MKVVSRDPLAFCSPILQKSLFKHDSKSGKKPTMDWSKTSADFQIRTQFVHQKGANHRKRVFGCMNTTQWHG
jgi:hypothetical protein